MTSNSWPSSANCWMYLDVLSYDKIIKLTVFLSRFLWVVALPPRDGRMRNGVEAVIQVGWPSARRSIYLVSPLESEIEWFWEIFKWTYEHRRRCFWFTVLNVPRKQHPANAPILYQYGALAAVLKRRKCWPTLKNRRNYFSRLYRFVRRYIGLLWQQLGMQSRSQGIHAWHHSWYETTCRRGQINMITISLSTQHHPNAWQTASCRLDTEKFGSIPDITDMNTTPNSSTTMFVKIRHRLKSWILESLSRSRCVRWFDPLLWVSSSSTKSKALEGFWDYAYDRVGYLGTNTPIKLLQVWLEGDFEPTERGFACPNPWQ